MRKAAVAVYYLLDARGECENELPEPEVDIDAGPGLAFVTWGREGPVDDRLCPDRRLNAEGFAGISEEMEQLGRKSNSGDYGTVYFLELKRPDVCCENGTAD